jgi:acyl-CoA synthetase (AMP-forming)/AMP-acid ligase II
VAYVVCSTELNEAALTSFCRGQLASFKVPKQFVQVDSLPRNAMGKLQKHLLSPS